MVPNEGGIAVHLNVLEVEVVCKVSKFFLEADGMAVSSHIPFRNVPNFKFKGGLISESIFNFVQLIKRMNQINIPQLFILVEKMGGQRFG